LLRHLPKENTVKKSPILFAALAAFALAGCATLTNEANVSIAFSFSDGSSGHCKFENKRGVWESEIPDSVSIRRSDDVLRYTCQTENGNRANGSIASEMGAKIIASAVFLDFGIVDAITDKHREYPASFVIPVKK
jgi:hypothetical protein